MKNSRLSSRNIFFLFCPNSPADFCTGTLVIHIFLSSLITTKTQRRNHSVLHVITSFCCVYDVFQVLSWQQHELPVAHRWFNSSAALFLFKVRRSLIRNDHLQRRSFFIFTSDFFFPLMFYGFMVCVFCHFMCCCAALGLRGALYQDSSVMLTEIQTGGLSLSCFHDSVNSDGGWKVDSSSVSLHKGS